MIRAILLPLAAAWFVFTQMLGWVGTCTMGDTDPWLAGSMLSFPALVLVMVFAVLTLRGGRARRPRLEMAAYAIVAAAAAWLLWANALLVRLVVVAGVGPCGPDFGPATREDVLTVFVFVALPFAVLVLSGFAIRRLHRQG